MTANIVLWVYIVLLVAGGVAGYVKAKSRISLLASLLFGALLSLVAMGALQPPVWADGILVFLLLFFGLRFAKTRKMMPGGMMTILTILALALRHLPIG
jgi:uncharacterized membrane protein (UPF0136 family)